jgi:hypothetical protein
LIACTFPAVGLEMLTPGSAPLATPGAATAPIAAARHSPTVARRPNRPGVLCQFRSLTHPVSMPAAGYLNPDAPDGLDAWGRRIARDHGYP